MEKKSKTAFGSLLSIVIWIISAMNFPDDVANAITRWSESSIEIPPEIVQMLLIAGLGTAAAFLLAPAVAELSEAAVRWAGASRSRKEDVDRMDKVLQATWDENKSRLIPLLDGPQEQPVDLRMKSLESAGLVVRINSRESMITGGFTRYDAVYELAKHARPVVLRFTDYSAPPARSKSS